MTRFRMVGNPSPVEAPAPGAGFRLKYRVENATHDPLAGHWDHVLIHDEHSFPVHEGWHTQGSLAAGAAYEAELEVRGLAAGRYEVELTIDGAGVAEFDRYELLIGTAAAGTTNEGPRPGGGVDERWAHTYHISVVTTPAPVEPLAGGHAFRIEYEAWNEGGQRSPVTKDWFRIVGTAATWDAWWQQEPVEPGQHYWPSVEVASLPAGDDYVLHWTLDAENPHADRAAKGETPFRLPASS